VGFDADIYYEHLYQCFQDLQFNRVDLDDHFLPFLLLADQAFADGTIPDAAILRLEALLCAPKPFLTRVLNINKRNKVKKSLVRVLCELQCFKEDRSVLVWSKVEEQKAIISQLRARIVFLETHCSCSANPVETATSSVLAASPPTAGTKPCSTCNNTLPKARFSKAQWRKSAGRKCLFCQSTKPSTLNIIKQNKTQLPRADVKSPAPRKGVGIDIVEVTSTSSPLSLNNLKNKTKNKNRSSLLTQDTVSTSVLSLSPSSSKPVNPHTLCPALFSSLAYIGGEQSGQRSLDVDEPQFCITQSVLSSSSSTKSGQAGIGPPSLNLSHA
jgi:hypothetical protein